MKSESEKPLDEYTQEGLQEYADSIYQRHHECKDGRVRMILKKKFKEIVTLYNKRSHGKIYNSMV